MKKMFFAVVLVAMLTVACQAEEKVVLDTDKAKESYAIGFSIGEDFQQQGIDVDARVLAKGMADAVAGSEAMLSEEERREVFTSLQKRMMEKQQQMAAEREKEMSAQGEKNLAEGKAFLEENGKKEGVVTLDSGLQYKVLKKGKGAPPIKTDKVTVHYHGTLVDGTVFDSSVDRGEPATFPVGGVIPGWVEALQLMPPGSKWQLFIPSELAYGERGAGPVIAPNAVLIFEVELLDINKAEKDADPSFHE
ncbi:MAG: hypothetical protein C0624_03950 [Desulfuromonas sp.]|nr:MAG: hypothetical protein C0624_03950 [Desulfuromonas sp.]